VSRTRPAVRGLLAALIALSAAGPALADAPRFQVDLSGLSSWLSGSPSLADDHDRRDLYPPGIGFAFSAEYGITQHLWFGVRSGLVREKKEGIDPAIALFRWQELPGYSSFRAARATKIDRDLTTIPTHAIVQWRGKLPGRIGYWDEIGVGVASFTDKIDYTGPSGPLMRLSAYQKNLSLLIGTGLSIDWKTAATFYAGVDIEMIPSEDGQIWNGGDNPQLAHVVVGLRYPRR